MPEGLLGLATKKILWRSANRADIIISYIALTSSIVFRSNVSRTALEVGLSLGSCFQQLSITSPTKYASLLSGGIGGRPPVKTENITELSSFFGENGTLFVKICVEGIQRFQ